MASRLEDSKLRALRVVITENLRVQRGGTTSIPYIESASELTDAATKQNHVIFGRRGCGKTLLLHESATNLPSDAKALYLNCEDYKLHSFPNVLIEILDSVFGELEVHLSGWFGKKRRSRQLISDIRNELAAMKEKEDERVEKVRETKAEKDAVDGKLAVGTANPAASMSLGAAHEESQSIEKEYSRLERKIQKLQEMVPQLKKQLREFFAVSSNVKSIALGLIPRRLRREAVR